MTSVRRCIACGGFFDAAECPNDHSNIEGYMPRIPIVARYKRLRGCVVKHEDSVCVIVSEPDENGMVGLSYLHERVRVNADDVEEID